MQKNKTEPLSYGIYKVNSKWIKDINKTLNFKTPGRKQRRKTP